MKRNIIVYALSALLCCSMLFLPVSATSIVVDTTVEEPAYTDPGTLTLMEKLKAWESYDVNLTYTPDSVRAEGIWLEPWTDAVKQSAGFKISSDIAFGVEIYDDPATTIIDGIRINGQEVSSLVYTFDLDNPSDTLVEVRLVYSENLLGDIAKMSDGTYNWTELIENPVMLMQLAYYVLAALSIIISSFAALSSKKKKVKTANEIADAVDARVQAGVEAFATQYSEYLKESLLPVISQMVETNKTVVKAITLSTSKAKEAPIALLDVLQEVSDVDAAKLIDEARASVLKNMSESEKKRAAMQAALHNISTPDTTREVSNDVSKENNTPEGSEENEAKSVF